MRRLLLLFILLFTVAFSYAQELNCEVTVITPKLQTTDPELFRDLENALNDFMNNRKWTNIDFESHEKIECRIVITITKETSNSSFEATASIQSSRPVYNSDYKTVVLNHSDQNFNFNYSQYQPIEFNENTFLNNLSSMLAYYAYIIIGLDFDTFEEKGGTPYFQKAKTIVNQAQTSDFAGWKSFNSLRNRFWLVDNLLSPRFSDFREGMHLYHFKGLDKMYDDRTEARAQIIEALKLFKRVEKNNPNSMIMQLFRNAKFDELMDIFNNASPMVKKEAVNNLRQIDPANASKYEAIMR